MIKEAKERQFRYERQPRLPLSVTDREVNRHDARREMRLPEQLDLISSSQLKLFDEDSASIDLANTE